MLKAPSGTNWAFGGFTVLTERRVLTGDGMAIPLTSKAFDTLVVLIENRHRVVTKDELLRSVWPDVEVEEGNLTQQIFLLRKALGESAQQPNYIVTVPGHGYRFTAAVNAVSNDPAATSLEASPPTAARRGVTLATGLAALSAIVVLVVGASRWMPATQVGVAGDFTKSITKITESGKATASAISPDGRYIAYIENDGDRHSLWVRGVGVDGKLPVIPPQPLVMRSLTFSPNSKQIYFARQSAHGPMFELSRIPTLGGPETLVLEDVDSPVSFSPDGREMVFQRGTAQGPTIVVAAAAGDSQRTLATRELPLKFSLFAPAWSPDGKFVAAVVNDTSKNSWSIVLLGLHDRSSRELYTTNKGVGRLRWLPDGSALLTAVSERLDRRQFGSATGAAIWRIAYPSGQAKQLTSDLTSHDSCCLDIDGTGSLITNVVNSLVSDLWIAPAEDLDARTQLTWDHPVVGRHSWLRDNDTMVYRDLAGRLNAVHKDKRAFSLPVPEGQEVTLGVSACGDGRYVVFSAMPGKNIWRVAPNAGGGAEKITSGFDDFNPACSPDGKHVLYASRDEIQGPSLWQVSIEGGAPTALNIPSSYDVVPSPSGRMIYYSTDFVEEGADRNRPNRWEVISSSDHTRLFTFEAAGDGNIGMMINWAPDESGLDYVVTRNGVSNIWRQLLTGGPPVQITRYTVGRIFSFAWSRDGQWLSLGSGAYRSDVVLLSSQP